MRYRKRIEVARDPEDVFAYVADFSNAAEWDPGVVEARRLGEGPIEVGSRFELTAVFRSKRHAFAYVVVELDPGRRIKVHGDGEKAFSDDTVTVEPAGSGAALTYEADIGLKGINRLGRPFLGIVFGRMGDRALASLKATLER